MFSFVLVVTLRKGSVQQRSDALKKSMNNCAGLRPATQEWTRKKYKHNLEMRFFS